MQNKWMCDQDRRCEISALQFFTPVLPTSHQVPIHTLRLIWCRSGKADVRLNTRKETISRSQMLLLSAGITVEITALEKDTVIGEIDITFCPGSNELHLPHLLNCCDEGYAELCLRAFEMLPFQDDLGITICMIDLLHRACYQERSASPAQKELVVASLLLAVSNAISDSAICSTDNEHVRQAIRYIQNHYPENISTDMIASNAHLHSNYLHRLFTAEMHCSIGEYLLNYRMENARRLLISSRMTVAEIARASGIPNHQHFSKLFRKHFGVSPIDFRKKYDITCNYTPARTQFGVINYAEPELSRPILCGIHPQNDPIFYQGDFVPIVKAYYNRADMLAVKDVTDHAHPLFEIMYVQEGMITVVVDNRFVTVKSGQYIWLNAGVQHRLILSNMLISVINIEFALIEAAWPIPSVRQLYQVDLNYRNMLEQNMPWIVLDDQQDAMGTLLRHTVLLADSTHPKKNMFCSGLVQQCLAEIAKESAYRQHDSLRENADTQAFEHISTQIERMYAYSLTVDALANACSMTPSRLQQLIRSTVGMSFSEYLEQVRIEKSKSFLLAGLSVSECARRVGFQSEYQFVQTFKTLTGIHPQDFSGTLGDLSAD